MLKKLFGKKFVSANYWETRYAQGGNSGDGSYGRLSHFKADFINAFIRDNNINSAIEFGCGDGNQLSLIHYPAYLGLDVSPSVIRQCIGRFSKDESKSFMLYDSNAFLNNQFIKADLSLSLDVIYHIVEESVYQKYLHDLFSASSAYVIIYSTNFNKNETEHVLHREFTKYVEQNFKKFRLLKEEKNPYSGVAEQESEANFFIYKRV